ncbi:molybdopterin-guanine dinucleotide biosynthesis protein B [Cochlodiniinecator piscidefendens]|uniref:molybdopterin-guanine dinucleotide biosynthesis protein B n=1 Tax=Cochlodiniinecator piscidefendens TaxID=2715756 RepID=UPI00140AD6FA|nr:molybdopterin-guanine dinucleotide biosynthesis protein B [Cochlodiniinecator piscidefendens]
MKIFGVTGWKNNGKTGLMERLVSEIIARGFTVSTVKHAHHSFDVDQEGRDSFRHRAAGAQQVMLSSNNRWALMTELREAEELSLEELLKQLNPVDLVLIEGYKADRHPKIEAHRAEIGKDLIARSDDSIVAVASDIALEGIDVPVIDLNDTNALADFVLNHAELEKV